MGEIPEIGTMVELNPDAIKPGLNSRWQGMKDVNLNDLITSIPEHGQMVPVEIWYDKKGEPNLEFGYRRLMAIKTLNEGRKEDKKLLVKCIVIKALSEWELFLRNVAENTDREDPSPMDQSHAQEIARTKFKKTGVDIAKAWRCTPANVTTLASLQKVIPEVQGMVHLGYISVQEAYSMVKSKVTPKEQKERCEEIAKSMNVSLPDVLAQKSRKGKKKKGKDAKDKNKSTAAILAALRLTSELPGCLPSLKKYCFDLAEWIVSKLSDIDLASLLTGLPNSEIEKLVELSEEEEEKEEEEDDDDEG